MTPYRYLKASARINTADIVKNKRSNKLKKAVAKLLLVSGFLVIASVLVPLVSYELFTAPSLKPQNFLSPVPAIGIERENVLSARSDYTQAENWFPQADFSEKKIESKITHYTISIPKFNIEDATVEIGGQDLSKSLIHYPGTALPGQLGATIIFGHSVLPQFYSPDNYMAIFSLIPTMELGDDIFVNFDGIRYTYRVIDKVEVKPDNLSVLDQPYDNEYLRLITCTPPGTYLRRGIISAALIN